MKILVNISKLTNNDKIQVNFNEVFKLLDSSKYNFDVSSLNVNFNGVIFLEGSLLVLEGEVNTEIHGVCDLCLTDVKIPIHFEIKEVFTNDATDDEDVNFFTGNEIDLYEVILTDIVLNLPVRTVCKEDCNGLCPHCGQNLNVSQCQCESEPDSPFAKFSKFF